MKAESRIYTVSNGSIERLVRATSRAQALRHVAEDVFKTRVASQNDIITHLSKNLKIEDATSDGHESLPLAPPPQPPSASLANDPLPATIANETLLAAGYDAFLPPHSDGYTAEDGSNV